MKGISQEAGNMHVYSHTLQTNPKHYPKAKSSKQARVNRCTNNTIEARLKKQWSKQQTHKRLNEKTGKREPLTSKKKKIVENRCR